MMRRADPKAWAVALAAGLVLNSAAMADETSLSTPLRFVKPREVSVTPRDELTGQLFPNKLVPLGFEMGGKVMAIKVQRGDVVKAGQSLALLDAEIADAQVAQAEAGLAAAEAGADIASDLAGRNVKLEAEGSVSEVQSKGATTQSKQAQAQVLIAKAGLIQARAARRKHELKSPMNGVVVDITTEVGMTVGPGIPFFIVQQVDPLIMKTTVSELMRGALKPGAKVKLYSIGGVAMTEEATIRVVIPTADPNTRRVPVEITVPNADGRFVANTLARVQLAVGVAQKAVVIPSTALGTQGGEHVFKVDDKGALRRVPVTVVERSPREVTVASAESLAQIVDYPTSSLIDGTVVPVAR